MAFRRLLTAALLLGCASADTSTCGELREVYLGAECCSADDSTVVQYGTSPSPAQLSPPPFSSPPPMAVRSPSPPGPPPVQVPTNYTGCDTTIVGAGAGGLYTAFRLVVDVGVAASSICIFEADSRAGGRIWSLRNQVRDACPPRRRRERGAPARASPAPPPLCVLRPLTHTDSDTHRTKHTGESKAPPSSPTLCLLAARPLTRGTQGCLVESASPLLTLCGVSSVTGPTGRYGGGRRRLPHLRHHLAAHAVPHHRAPRPHARLLRPHLVPRQGDR